MDGIIVINKVKGCTSHDVVYQVKKLFGEKVGHTGTLDPNATGVLPILLGKGTELSQFMINHDKKYVATIKLGIKTDTADVEGDVVEEKDVDFSKVNASNVIVIFSKMIGKQMQRPPMYSAIKVKGKKLYEYAREGKTVNVPKREIEIYDLKLLDINNDEKTLTFEIYCSKGTYVRSVCEKIAEALETVGYMQELNRTMVGEFNIEKSVTIEELKENIDNKEFIKNNVITIENYFKDHPKQQLDDKKLRLFLNGVKIESNCQDETINIYDASNTYIGIGICKDHKLKRKIVVNG